MSTIFLELPPKFDSNPAGRGVFSREKLKGVTAEFKTAAKRGASLARFAIQIIARDVATGARRVGNALSDGQNDAWQTANYGGQFVPFEEIFFNWPNTLEPEPGDGRAIPVVEQTPGSLIKHHERRGRLASDAQDALALAHAPRVEFMAALAAKTSLTALRRLGYISQRNRIQNGVATDNILDLQAKISKLHQQIADANEDEAIMQKYPSRPAKLDVDTDNLYVSRAWYDRLYAGESISTETQAQPAALSDS